VNNKPVSFELNEKRHSMSDEIKLSGVEATKAASRFLAGEIAGELVDDQDHFGKDSVQLL
jgi:glycine cleavage system H lipoate-binding protein